MIRIITTYILITLCTNCFPQERQVTVPFEQPPAFTGNAGNDLSIYENHAYSLGNQIELQGGTPEYFYRWVSPGSDTIVNQMIVIVNTTGTFYLIVTDANHCTFVDSLTVSYVTPSNDPVYKANEIYPNPANDFLHYRIVTQNSPAELTLINAGGHVVFKRTIMVTADYIDGDLDIQDIPPGSYIFSVRTTSTEFSDKIIIKR